MKTRARLLIILAATLPLATLIMLPRISEAKRFGWFGQDNVLSVSLPLTGSPGQDQKADITVVASYQNDTSIPVRDMKPQPVLSKGQHENENPKIPTTNHKNSPDPVVQDRFEVLKSLVMPLIGGRLYTLVYPGILRDDDQFQLAHTHRLVQVPGLWWRSDTNPNADSDTAAAAHSNADTHARSKRPERPECYGRFHKSGQPDVDG